MKNFWTILTILLSGFLLPILYMLFTTPINDIELTVEERAAFISEYEVLSVKQYIHAKTNLYGGIIGSDICYAFTYVDEKGKLQTVDGFQHLEYGLTKVCIGEKNKYVIDRFGEDKKYLVLTKEILNSL